MGILVKIVKESSERCSLEVFSDMEGVAAYIGGPPLDGGTVVLAHSVRGNQ